MKRPASEIKQNYPKFKSIVFEKKIITVNPIEFNRDKPSRPDRLYHTSITKHPVLNDNIDFIAEQCKYDASSYKFQLRCKEFYKEPLFRFDSDGLSHKNDDLPLAQQQITTPHFNSFDTNGKPYAYKTPELELLDHNELKDISKFFSLFCRECQLVAADNSTPDINSGDVRLLNLDLHREDLLSDVNFDI